MKGIRKGDWTYQGEGYFGQHVWRRRAHSLWVWTWTATLEEEPGRRGIFDDYGELRRAVVAAAPWPSL
jgi:hypothetical protein